MKQLFKSLSLLLLLSACGKNETVIGQITGKINEYKGEETLLVLNGEKENLEINDDGSFKIDAPTGKDYKQYRVVVPDMGYLMGIYNAKAGDNVYMELTPTGKPFTSDVKFSGDNKELNSYSNDFFAESSFARWMADDIILLPFKDYAVKADSLKRKMLLRIKELNVGQFEEQLEEQVNIWALNTKLSHCWINKNKNGTAIDSDPEFVQFVKSIDLNNAKILNNDLVKKDYIMLAQSVIRWHYFTDKSQQEKYNNNNIAILSNIKNLVSNQNMINAIATNVISNYFTLGADQYVDEVYELFEGICTDEKDRKEIKEKYSSFSKLEKGNMAPDAPLTTLDNETVMLSEHRGKVLYIDLWATWCGPCLKESPYFDKLSEEYKGSNIEFVSVSLDKDQEAWKRFLKKHPSDLKHYIGVGGLKSEIAKKYGIVGIPRFMLIDEKGKIIDANAPRPSSNEIKEILNTYK